MAQQADLGHLKTLAQLLPGFAGDAPETKVSGLTLDSRNVRPGDLFLAVSGEQHDGRQFIEQAVAGGAAAVVAEAPVAGFVDALPVPLVEIPELAHEVGEIAARFYGNPSATLSVTGVTGTNGKTTVSRLIAQLSRLGEKPCGVIGTLGMTLSDEVAESRNTTPDPVLLQRQLSEWRSAGVPRVAMEVSSHALVQGRVAGMQFDTAVFTNLSHDHLDYHGDMVAYGQAKARLFQWPELRHAIINIDDAYGATLAQRLGGDTLLSYSRSDSTAGLYLSDIEYHTGGARAILHSPWGEGWIDSPLPGAFNLDNLVAAIAVCAVSGDALPAVLARVPQLRGVPGRMESVPNEAGLAVLIDYAHTPDALEQVLRAASPHVEGQLWVVFGCGGDRDAQKRPVMGRIATDLADRAVLTSDNPRGEDPDAILADIARGCSGDHIVIADRAEAIRHAVGSAQPGDCVLIAGKGHEDYQLVGAQRLHFSDREQAQAALLARAPS